MSGIQNNIEFYPDGKIKKVCGSEDFINKMIEKFPSPQPLSEGEIGIKKILLRVIKGELLPTIILVILLLLFVYLIRNYLSLLVTIFIETNFADLLMQSSIGMAAIMATIVLSSHLLEKHGNEHLLDWEARTELTKIAFMTVLVVIFAFALPFITKLFFTNGNSELLNMVGIIFILTFIFFALKTFFFELRLIKRVVGYSIKHEK